MLNTKKIALNHLSQSIKILISSHNCFKLLFFKIIFRALLKFNNCSSKEFQRFKKLFILEISFFFYRQITKHSERFKIDAVLFYKKIILRNYLFADDFSLRLRDVLYVCNTFDVSEVT